LPLTSWRGARRSSGRRAAVVGQARRDARRIDVLEQREAARKQRRQVLRRRPRLSSPAIGVE
jgi:hypothetical protein